ATPNNNLPHPLPPATNGTSAAQNVSLSDPLPAGVTFVSLTNAVGFVESDPGVGNNGTVSFSATTLASGATATFSITVHLAANLAQGTQLNNTATATTTTSDPTPGDLNNVSTATTTVNTQADLMVTMSAPTSVSRGTNFNYTVTVTNLGPDPALNVMLVDSLPAAGINFVSQSQISGPSFTLS